MTVRKTFLRAVISVSSRLSVKSSNRSGRSRKRSSESRLSFLSFFRFSVLVFVSLQFPGAGSSRRSAAGLDDDKSCDIDVEDELVPELDGNPWNNKRYEVFLFAYNFLPLFGQPWFLTADPVTGVSVFFAVFSVRWNCRRIIEYLHLHEEIKIVNETLCFLVCLHLLIGRHQHCWIPGSPQGLQFF